MNLKNYKTRKIDLHELVWQECQMILIRKLLCLDNNKLKVKQKSEVQNMKDIEVRTMKHEEEKCKKLTGFVICPKRMSFNDHLPQTNTHDVSHYLMEHNISPPENTLKSFPSAMVAITNENTANSP